jgi:hypothetical protein
MDEEVIPVLRVADAARAVAWYERLQFHKEWEHRFEPVTLAAPPGPRDSIFHDQHTTPLAPAVCADPLKLAGDRPFEYTTLAVQTGARGHY